MFGVLPMDAFEKGMTFTGAYTLHFNDLLAWEIGQFTYSYRIKTNLYDDLKDLQQPTAPTPFETVKYFVTSSLVFKPVYLKMAALNSGVAFGEMFFIAGGGYGWLTITGRPIVNFGAGMRVYAGSYVSFRIDIRDYMFLSTDDVKNELWVALGISLGFN
jgi:outer membrane beta-barrel protein